jgi:hypothetical protein
MEKIVGVQTILSVPIFVVIYLHTLDNFFIFFSFQLSEPIL